MLQAKNDSLEKLKNPILSRVIDKIGQTELKVGLLLPKYIATIFISGPGIRRFIVASNFFALEKKYRSDITVGKQKLAYIAENDDIIIPFKEGRFRLNKKTQKFISRLLILLEKMSSFVNEYSTKTTESPIT